VFDGSDCFTTTNFGWGGWKGTNFGSCASLGDAGVLEEIREEKLAIDARNVQLGLEKAGEMAETIRGWITERMETVIHDDISADEMPIGPGGALVIANALADLAAAGKRASSIRLTNSAIGDEGLQHLIPYLTGMSEVHIENNGITDTGLLALAQAISEGLQADADILGAEGRFDSQIQPADGECSTAGYG
jgi:hypothetical protein